jgi:MFS family permease
MTDQAAPSQGRGRGQRRGRQGGRDSSSGRGHSRRRSRDSSSTRERTDESESLLSPSYRWTTVGAFSLIFISAFETLAVTTIMPRISEELNGQALYSAAFSSTLAASVVGMVVSGNWADRTGPARPLISAILTFILGLLISGTSTDMVVFIAGRFLQGLGSGAVIVALYVMVARIYPAPLHPRIFGSFAAAWVLPSMIGPPVAGVVADTTSWHWVFLGVVVLAVGFGALIVPALMQLQVQRTDAHPQAQAEAPPAAPAPSAAARPRTTVGQLVAAILVAVAVVAISVSGESKSVWSTIVAGLAAVIVVLAIRPLVPTGTLLVRRGLPATILLRGAVAAAFFSVEVYLPYFLIERYEFSSGLAGLILTIGAVSWAIGSYLQGRLGANVSSEAVLRIGAVILSVGILAQLLNALTLVSLALTLGGWFIAGAGMGLMFPRIGTLVLAHSTEANQGFNSAALSITDATGAATAIAGAGLLFIAVDSATNAATGSGFTAGFALSAALGLLAIPIAFRARIRS